MSDIGSPLALAAIGDGGETPAGGLTRGARMVSEMQTAEAPLIGYIAIGIYADGEFTCGFRTPDDHMIGRTLFAAFIKEIVERKLTGEQAAEDYCRENLL